MNAHMHTHTHTLIRRESDKEKEIGEEHLTTCRKVKNENIYTFS